MKAGDVVFVRGNSIISKIIKFFDKGNFSHVAIAVSETEVMEINWNIRAKIVPFYYKDYEIIDLKLDDEQRNRVLPVASSLVGKRYDFFQIAGYFFRLKINSKRKLICSELVVKVLYEIGYFHDESLRSSTPNELYKNLKGVGF